MQKKTELEVLLALTKHAVKLVKVFLKATLKKDFLLVCEKILTKFAVAVSVSDVRDKTAKAVDDSVHGVSGHHSHLQN